MASSAEIHAFNTLINQLKLIERYKGQTYWKDYPAPRWDSVADHSWRLAMLVVMFAGKLSQPLDMEKAIKMALIHDIPEIIAGDASPLGVSGTGQDSYAYNQDIQAKRFKDEQAAAKAVFEKLGAEGNELYELWLEIEALENFEAKVVKALDKIEAMSQVLDWRKGHMFPKHLEFTVTYGSKGSDVDPAIAEYAAHVAGLMRSQYKEFCP
jgi:5'-deoxynucleotidase YfbR-like HD superfamily hydrolase